MSTHELARPAHDPRHRAPMAERAAGRTAERAAEHAVGPAAEHATGQSDRPPAPEAAPARPGPAVRPATTRRLASGAGDPLGGTAAPADLVDALRRRRGAGRPLPPQVATQFGEHLGTDLSGVRVHADAEADRISRSVQAVAFTHGTDVYFTQGAYAPESSRGQHLLAHELAHVVQERSAGAPAGPAGPVIGRADDPAEAAADATADRVLTALHRRAGSGEGAPQ